VAAAVVTAGVDFETQPPRMMGTIIQRGTTAGDTKNWSFALTMHSGLLAERASELRNLVVPSLALFRKRFRVQEERRRQVGTQSVACSRLAGSSTVPGTFHRVLPHWTGAPEEQERLG
jgi:hypothetical protein